MRHLGSSNKDQLLFEGNLGKFRSISNWSLFYIKIHQISSLHKEKNSTTA
ncbi:MAG: hypothetical protein K0S25_891 [Bacillus sp. (in: firmicutes)]|jgi:hypothetical protein|nr:hypothetical protein [Bacillus sp. (in: firmicutes)]